MTIYRKSRSIDYPKLRNNVRHGGTVAPQANVQMAQWLPRNTDSTNAANGFYWIHVQETNFDNYIVLPEGKVVAYDSSKVVNSSATSELSRAVTGYLVPAGVRLAWKELDSGDDALVYTTDDVTNRTLNLATGQRVTGAVTYTKAELTAALIARGLLKVGETLEKFISPAVGYLSNAGYVNAGGDGEQVDNLDNENYKRTDGVTFWTGDDNAIRVNHFPEVGLTESVPAISTVLSAFTHLTGGAPKWATGAGGQLASVLENSVTGASLKSKRYSDLTNTNYVALVLGTVDIEHNLYNPITITSSGTDITSTVLKKEQKTPNQLNKAGDYFVDRDLGIIFFYENGGNALPSGLTQSDVVTFAALKTHSNQNAASTAQFVGPWKPGCPVTYNKFSDYCQWLPRPDDTEAENAGSVDYVDPTTFHRPEDLIGRCYSCEDGKSDSLASVYTHHTYPGVPLNLRMPGSATEGNDVNVAVAQGSRRNVIIRINL